MASIHAARWLLRSADINFDFDSDSYFDPSLQAFTKRMRDSYRRTHAQRTTVAPVALDRGPVAHFHASKCTRCAVTQRTREPAWFWTARHGAPFELTAYASKSHPGPEPACILHLAPCVWGPRFCSGARVYTGPWVAAVLHCIVWLPAASRNRFAASASRLRAAGAATSLIGRLLCCRSAVMAGMTDWARPAVRGASSGLHYDSVEGRRERRRRHVLGLSTG